MNRVDNGFFRIEERIHPETRRKETDRSPSAPPSLKFTTDPDTSVVIRVLSGQFLSETSARIITSEYRLPADKSPHEVERRELSFTSSKEEIVTFPEKFQKTKSAIEPFFSRNTPKSSGRSSFTFSAISEKPSPAEDKSPPKFSGRSSLAFDTISEDE
jgi:hypothetical protein